VALLDDCVSAAMFAAKPLAMARPAGSSAPLLMRDPEDSCSSVELRLLLVMFSWFSAASAAMLFKIVSAIDGAPPGSDFGIRPRNLSGVRSVCPAEPNYVSCASSA
jgi:hypothetical protein